MRRRASLLLSLLPLLLALGVGAACQKEAKPPPPPPKCGKVERGSDRVVEVVLCAEADADEDGVDDAVDLCPEHQETINGHADKDGCPDPDRDLDLFVDYEDACPDEKGVAPDGCPGVDSDGDLIADHLDSCPHEPEDMDGDRDSDGCPDGPQDATVAKALEEQLWQKARIDVRRGKARTTKVGAAALEELAAVVATRPADVKRVRIVGYSSLREVRRGKAKDLAKDRVKLVEARLLEAGVSAKAIERAVYPLKGKRERVGRVDVMVFLDLAAAMRGHPKAEGTTTSEPEETPKPTEAAPAPSSDPKSTQAEPKPAPRAEPEAEPKPEPEPAPQAASNAEPTTAPKAEPKDAKPDAKATPAPSAEEPYPEPAAPADEDWDLGAQ